jgi:hypothetical protein
MSIQSAILSAFGGEDEAEAVVDKKVETKPEPTTKPTATTVTITQKYNIPSQQGNVIAPTPVQKPKVEIKIPDVRVGDEVKHKTFGTGTISFMDKAQKKLRVKFAAGEKVFVYPNAFIDGFLQAKE